MAGERRLAPEVVIFRDREYERGQQFNYGPSSPLGTSEEVAHAQALREAQYYRRQTGHACVVRRFQNAYYTYQRRF